MRTTTSASRPSFKASATSLRRLRRLTTWFWPARGLEAGLGRDGLAITTGKTRQEIIRTAHSLKFDTRCDPFPKYQELRHDGSIGVSALMRAAGVCRCG